jgi:nicotinate-nucleotide adenylyltransferase
MTKRIGILGGTFNPVHVGHLLAARRAQEALRLDQVLFLPCNRPALKSHESLWPAAFRLKLLWAALKGQPGFSVEDLELKRGGVSYTVETLEALRSRYRGADFFFLLGTDAALDLPRWKRADDLKSLARLVVLTRPGAQFPVPGSRLIKRFGLQMLQIPSLEVSSTEIRNRLKQGHPIAWMVPRAVEGILLKACGSKSPVIK